MRDKLQNGLFGKLSNRDQRLLILGIGLGMMLASTSFMTDAEESITLIIGAIIVSVLSINQYNRVKNGIDPKASD